MKKYVFTLAAFAFAAFLLKSQFGPVRSIRKEVETKQAIAAVVTAKPAAGSRQSKAVRSIKIAKVVNPAPVNPIDLRLLKITNLLQVVVPTEYKMNALRKLLNDPELRANIHSALNDPTTYSGDKFSRKLRLLDVLYEGLKFPDQSISESYEVLAQKILSEPAPAAYGSHPERQHQFRADRAEIALVILKTMPRDAQQMQSVPAARGAFEEAARLQSVYEVAL